MIPSSTVGCRSQAAGRELRRRLILVVAVPDSPCLCRALRPPLLNTFRLISGCKAPAQEELGTRCLIVVMCSPAEASAVTFQDLKLEPEVAVWSSYLLDSPLCACDGSAFTRLSTVPFSTFFPFTGTRNVEQKESKKEMVDAPHSDWKIA